MVVIWVREWIVPEDNVRETDFEFLSLFFDLQIQTDSNSSPDSIPTQTQKSTETPANLKIHTEMQGPRVAETILKKNKVRGITLPVIAICK